MKFLTYKDFDEWRNVPENNYVEYRSKNQYNHGHFYIKRYVHDINAVIGYWRSDEKSDFPSFDFYVFNKPYVGYHHYDMPTPSYFEWLSMPEVMNKINECICNRKLWTAPEDLPARANNYNVIKSVKINNPAVIIFWMDGTKTVAVAKDTEFDPYVGFYVAYAKKFEKPQINKGIKMLEKEIGKMVERETIISSLLKLIKDPSKKEADNG